MVDGEWNGLCQNDLHDHLKKGSLYFYSAVPSDKPRKINCLR